MEHLDSALSGYPCPCPDCRPPSEAPQPRLDAFGYPPLPSGRPPLQTPSPRSPAPHLATGILGAQPAQPRTMVSTREMWAMVKHRIQWIEEQYQSMERDHAHEEGRSMVGPGKTESRPLFTSIKAFALIKLMRAALAVLDALSELIPA